MRRRNLMAWLAVVFAVLFGTNCTEQTRAAGYWNMPGTHAQRAGHGYGGGYHAPLVLGPVRCDGWGLGAPARLPCAPVPYYGCGSCGDCGRMVEAPSSMESVVPTTAQVETPTIEHNQATAPGGVALDPEPVVEPAVAPIVEPVRPLFDAPVQP